MVISYFWFAFVSRKATEVQLYLYPTLFFYFFLIKHQSFVAAYRLFLLKTTTLRKCEGEVITAPDASAFNSEELPLAMEICTGNECSYLAQFLFCQTIVDTKLFIWFTS